MTIKFEHWSEAATRLQNPAPLNEDEARALFTYTGYHGMPTYLLRIQMDLALQQIAAINRFNKVSGQLTAAAIFVGIAPLVVALIALVIAIWW